MSNLVAPNFFGIGAGKSGTTALHHYLDQHHEVSMSRRKEANFFAFDERPPTFGGPGDRTILNRDIVWRLDDYLRLFAHTTDEKAIGDISPRYLHTPGAAERIHRRHPDARLIAIFRQPADRAWSNYMMRRRDGFEPCDTLEAALAAEPQRVAENWGSGRYFEGGLYGDYVGRYLELFDRRQMRFYLFDDLVENPVGLFRDLFGFLGVDPDFVPDMSYRPNPSGELSNPLLRWAWTRTHPVRDRVRLLLPKTIRQAVSRWVTGQPMNRRRFPPALRAQLTERYRDQILLLGDLIDRDLSHWLDLDREPPEPPPSQTSRGNRRSVPGSAPAPTRGQRPSRSSRSR